MTAATFTRSAVTRWMRDEVFAYRQHLDECGEVNMTSLAESCAAAFDRAGVGGPLDDSTHWIWDVAREVHDEHDEARS